MYKKTKKHDISRLKTVLKTVYNIDPQDDPNVTKVVKLAQMLREIFAQVTSINGKLLLLL